MPETAETVFKDAMDDITVNPAETPIEATDFSVIKRAYNRMMESLAADGISLGHTTVVTNQSPITIPDGAVDATIVLLSDRIWGKFRPDELKPASMVRKVFKARRLLAKIGRVIADQSFPTTLPMGSGNTAGGYLNNQFYTGNDNTIDTEYNQTISTEDNTEV